MTGQSGVWQLRFDVLSVRWLAALAVARRRGTLKPEVHLFLADRYERLAAYHDHRGASARGRHLGEKARWHYAQAGFDDFPHAVAVAMPRPRPWTFTDARGRHLSGGSDPAA